jgi:hypothetical protein
MVDKASSPMMKPPGSASAFRPDRLLGVAAVSLCLAVSALPVLAAGPANATNHHDCAGLGDPSFFRDEGINFKLSTKLKWNKALMRENIQTKVNGGIATLSGTVSTLEFSRLAARLAAEVTGVRCVSNQLIVGPPPPPSPTATN